jgi:DNA-binding LacI/PurR family transcriptional regulator
VAVQGTGPRRPTIEDVARAAGVSRGTVSRVLNGGSHVRPEVMARVNSAVTSLGYSVNQAARNLASGKTGSVAYVISEHHEHLFGDPNFGNFVRIFSRELRKQGRHLIVTTAQDYEEEKFLGEYLTAGHVDGALFALPHEGEALLERLARTGLPLVVQGQPVGYEESLSWVAIDDEAAAFEAVTYLAGQGRSRIATVTGPLNTSSGRGRLAGYRRAVGLGRSRGWSVEGDWTMGSGRRGAHQLVHRHPDMDGLFVGSDLMALGALEALREAGRDIPEHVAVVGFDDSAAALAADPPLTTVNQSFEKAAVEAVRVLGQLIDGALSGPQHVLVPTRLVRRRSA